MTGSPAASDRPLFELLSLGETVLRRLSDGRPSEELLRGGKVIALLIYLVSQDGPVSRDVLADLLWGDEAPERARASLRQALYALRRLLGEEVLVGDRHRVALRPGAVASDRDVVIAGARAGDLGRMLEVYAGPFGATLEVGAATRFLEWMEDERGRLRHLLLEVAHRTLPVLLRAGPVGQAVRLARQVHRLEPEDLETLVLLVDALIAIGEVDEARERVASAIAAYRTAGDLIPEALRTREQRLARQQGDGQPLRGTLEALGHLLVGRDVPAAQLLVEAERARTEGPRRVLLTGPSGVGKSRLLDEVEARLRLRGARVVRVRFLPAMRDIPNAALADLVRALVQLPGSLGIAEEAAQELVTLLPELTKHFPSARLDLRSEGSASEDRRFQRREALGELLAAVADDRLVVVLLDDLAWADEASRQILEGVRRGPALRLLEVITCRPGAAVEALAPDRTLVLSPWGAGEVRQSLEAVAPLPAAPWVDALIDQLTARTRGIPQGVFLLIRAVVTMGHLTPTATAWISEDPEALVEAVRTHAWLEDGLAWLTAAESQTLLLLVRWARPMEERDLLAIGTTMAGRGGEVMRRALRRLEGLGLILSRDTRWEVASDAVIDAVAWRVIAGEPAATFDQLARHWGDPTRLDLEHLEHLALLAGANDQPRLAVQIARAAADAPLVRVTGLRGRRLAQEIARWAGRPEWARPCLSAMGLLARQTDRGRALLGGVATLAAGAVVWLAAMLQPRLRFEVEPMADHPGRSHVDLSVQPRAVVENGFGTIYQIAMPVRLVSDDAQVIGDATQTVRDGRIQFERIALRLGKGQAHTDRDLQLRVEGPWFVRGASALVRGSRTLPLGRMFRIVSGTINGRPLGDSLVVRVPPGDSLQVTLTFAYSTSISTANYVVGALPTWGRREREVIRLAGLPSPVVDAWRTVRFEVPPPPGPGTHHLVFLFDAEDGVDFLFSLTNWTYGRPRWNDGNDVPDLGVAAFESLRTRGSVPNVRYLHARQGVRLSSPWFVEGAMPVPDESEITRELIGSAIRVEVER